MLDMSFQILSFFIMTYHPPRWRPHRRQPGAADRIRQESAGKQVEQIVAAIGAGGHALPELQDALTVAVSSINGACRASFAATQNRTYPPPNRRRRATSWKEAKQKLAAELKQISREPGTEKANIKIARRRPAAAICSAGIRRLQAIRLLQDHLSHRR